MIHLSKIEKFSKKIDLKKISYFTKKGNITFKSPDLIAVDIKKDSYGIFESKGYSIYNTQGIERAYNQAKSIKHINGKNPQHRLAVMTQTGSKEFKMFLKDPDGDNIDIDINLVLLYLYHYIPIVELITELEPKVINNRIVGTFEDNDISFKISLTKEIYDELSFHDGSIYDIRKWFNTFLNRNNEDWIKIFKSQENILIID